MYICLHEHRRQCHVNFETFLNKLSTVYIIRLLMMIGIDDTLETTIGSMRWSLISPTVSLELLPESITVYVYCIHSNQHLFVIVNV